MDKNHREHCIALLEAKKKPGYRPGQPHNRKDEAWDKLKDMPMQSSPRRG